MQFPARRLMPGAHWGNHKRKRSRTYQNVSKMNCKQKLEYGNKQVSYGSNVGFL